jgi:hypothetical protein
MKRHLIRLSLALCAAGALATAMAQESNSGVRKPVTKPAASQPAPTAHTVNPTPAPGQTVRHPLSNVPNLNVPGSTPSTPPGVTVTPPPGLHVCSIGPLGEPPCTCGSTPQTRPAGCTPPQ